MADKWTVIGQQQTVALGPSGSFVPVVQVRFQTAAGHVGTVEVPVSTYGVDTVRAAIDDYAERLDTVGQL